MDFRFLLFFSLLLAGTINAQVKVSLKNETGKRIDSLVIENVCVVTIEQKSVKTITFDQIVCERNEPIFRLSANIGNEIFERGDEAFQCATFLKTFSEGEFKRTITLFLLSVMGKPFYCLKKINNAKRPSEKNELHFHYFGFFVNQVVFRFSNVGIGKFLNFVFGRFTNVFRSTVFF